MRSYEYLARILEVDSDLLKDLGDFMSRKTGNSSVLDNVAQKNRETIERTLNNYSLRGKSASEVRNDMMGIVLEHEKQFLNYLDSLDGDSEFEKAVLFAKQAVRGVGKGFFLKKGLAKEVLRKRPPEKVLRYFKLSNIEELFQEYDVAEIFSSLRFLESDEWMHKTFEETYSNFTSDDFEERDIEIKVLSSAWKELAEEFVEKKHHNVSHLKELGIVFINPIRMDVPGKFLRDIPLLLHYFHEIDFYSKLFRKYKDEDNFAEHVKSLLRGDVPEKRSVNKGEWLIVQRYLWKIDPEDPRLSLPRVNPESMHWSRGERDVAFFGALKDEIDFELWHDLDWVAGLFPSEEGSEKEEIVSFDLEDNAFSLASFTEGRKETFTYHQRDAMWTKIFEDYVGGEEKMEELLINNFDKGVIQF